MLLTFLILLFYGVVVELFYKIKRTYLGPLIPVIVYIQKRNTWFFLHFPRKQMGNGLGKPKLSSIVSYKYKIFLCLTSDSLNSANAALFQIKTIQNWLNILYLCYAIVYRGTGRYWFWCWIILNPVLSLNQKPNWRNLGTWKVMLLI